MNLWSSNLTTCANTVRKKNADVSGCMAPAVGEWWCLANLFLHETPSNIFLWTVIFGTCVPYKQNCHTSTSFTLKYHTIPRPLTSPPPKWPRRLARETCFSRTSRAPTPEKTATSSRLPHDFSSGQSYHDICMQVIRPVLHNLPCYLHRTYQVLCFNNYTLSKLPLCFVHKL